MTYQILLLCAHLRARVDVSTAPAPRAAAKSVTFDNKPKQGASNRVVAIVVVGIVLLAILVWSKSGKDGDDAAAPTMPSATATMTDEQMLRDVKTSSSFYVQQTSLQLSSLKICERCSSLQLSLQLIYVQQTFLQLS